MNYEDLGNNFEYQLLVLVITLITLFLIKNSKLNHFYKNLIYSLIIVEFLNLGIFQRQKYSLPLVMLLIFICLYLIFNSSKSYIGKFSLNFRESNFLLTRFGSKNLILLGSSIIIGSIALDYSYSDSSLGSLNIFLILAGFSWIVYALFYNHYKYELFFQLCFFNILIFIYIIPIFLINNVIIFGEGTDSLVQIFLMLPLKNLLTFAGYNIFTEGQLLYYPDKVSGFTNSVLVTEGCSGIYSILLFISAHMSYMLASKNFSKLDFFVLFLIGVLMSYISNILRMFIIMLVGIELGSSPMIFVHTHLGWLLFTFWMLIFFFISDKFVSQKN